MRLKMLKEQSFDAPIPGMSMTAELGARPWQSPPKYATVDDAIEYYLDRMSSEDFLDQLTDVMEMGVPITSIANTMQLGNVMEGMHSVDVGMLVLPVLVEMMMLVGDSAGVEYDSGLSKSAPMNDKRTRNTLVAKTARKLQIQLNEKEGKENNDEPMMDKPDMEEEDTEEKTMGLMGRRK
tara:strand:- start:1280 stop:1819 length:540 start_codon:yes stop_codon:yes gene_type:complete